MIKAILLILNPVRTWDDIVEDKRRLLSILFAYLIPLLLISCAVEGYGLATWGKWRSQVRRVMPLTIQQVLVYEAAQFTFGLLLVFVGAKLIKSLGETFHGRHTFTQAFTTVAYGLGPVFLVRMFDAFPTISPWVTWAIGIALSAAVLYHGVPRVMQPDPPHAFGLYLTSVLLLAMTSGLVRFITAWALQGKFKQLNVIFSDIMSRLHF